MDIESTTKPSFAKRAILCCSLFATALFVCAVIVSCTWKSAAQPSVLVILVENLGFGAFSCGEGDESGRGSGFQNFCDEAVRFTHAYTPSVMSQATIASLLTAKYPYQHGVRTNGAQTLAAKEETLAEAALARGYKTSFFSGGPPVWRRSGLNQGFEIFDDGIPVNTKTIYRAASEIVKLYLNWQSSEASREKSLSFLFLSDLQFVDVPTTNDLGEVREISYKSQLDAIDVALSSLIREMKARKIWDSTDIFLVGLQGDALEGRVDIRPDEMASTDLFSESTRTTLMIKPARKNREGPFNWKIDKNVSLTDVGATLFEAIGDAKVEPIDREPEAPIYSLKSALKGPSPDWPTDRMIVSESAWPQWRGFGQTRVAVRSGPYLFLFDDRPMLYNTLTDNLEITPLPSADSRTFRLREDFSEFLRENGFRMWRSPTHAEMLKADLARDLWRDREPNAETLQRLRALSKRYSDPQLSGWRAIWALRMSDWAELKAVAGVPSTQPLWSYVADRNLGIKTQIPAEPCLEFLKSAAPLNNPQVPKTCRQEGVADLLAAANEAIPESARQKAIDQFTRYYAGRVIAARVSEHNQVVGLKWDAIPMQDFPDMLDLVLSLPELRKTKSLLKLRLASERR